MKLTAGSVFILGVLLIGGSGLVGGQVWVYSGSILLASVVSGVTLVALVVALRAFLRRASASLRVRFLGEAGDAVDTREFVEEVTEEDLLKARIEKDAQQRPDEIARSISTLLGTKGQKQKKGS